MTQKPLDPLSWPGALAGPDGGYPCGPASRSTDPIYLVELGNTYLQMGSLPDAAAAFRKAIALDPSLAEAQFNLATVLSALGDTAGAIDGYRQAVVQRPDFFEAHFNLGDTLGGLGRLEEAADSYRRAVEINPQVASAHNNLGTILIEMGDFDGAVAALERAAALAPDAGDVLSNLGTALKHAERLDEAAAAQRRAAELSPGSGKACFNLGLTLTQAGRLEEAEPVLRKALDLQPDLVRIYPALGGMLMAAGRAEEALEICDRFLAKDPAQRTVLAFKALLLTEMGRDRQALHLADYERLILPVDIKAPDGYEDLAAFNAALLDHVLTHPSLVVSPTSHATVNGRHTGNLLVEPKGPFADFEKILWQAASRYREGNPQDLDHPYLADPPELTGLAVWSVVMDREGHQVPHIHPSGWLSGVYYAELPSVIEQDTEAREGWIEFGMPPPEIPMSKTPHVKIFKPKLGRLFLFPSYYYHRTVPYRTQERRVSIAFDFLPAR